MRYGRLKRSNAGFLAELVILCLGLFASAASSDTTTTGHLEPAIYTAIVRHVSGTVQAGGNSGASVNAGDILVSGQTFTTGKDGTLTLRFHPDMMVVDVQPSSRVTVEFSKSDPNGSRKLVVVEGRVMARVAQGVPLLFEDRHGSAAVQAGRVAYASGAGEAAVFVLEGAAAVSNRQTGATAVVSAGGKAVSNDKGTIVSRASRRELAAAGLHQNTLEVDFWNPATEEYRTLEIEFEARPGGR